MSEQQVLSVAKQLERIGATLLSVPTSTIVQSLTYSELSAFLDRMVFDIMIHAPELFSETAFDSSRGSGAMSTSALKLYLYGLCLDWFQKQGCLSTTGGFVAPEATGLSVPSPLLAWLSYIAKYKEGGTEAIPAYAVSDVPVISAGYIFAGTPVATDLAIGYRSIHWFSRNTTSAEYGMKGSGYATFNGITLPAFWASYAKIYSDLIKRAGYPTVEMPSMVPMAPDGSFFCTVWNGGCGGSITASNAYLGSAFHRVDREIALLYYEGSETDSNIAQAVRTFPVMLPHAMRDIQLTGYVPVPTLLTGAAAFDIAKGYFIMVLRTMNYTLGMDVGRDKNWAGEKISSFYPIDRVVSMDFYTQAVYSVLQEVAKISNVAQGLEKPFPTFDATAMAAFMVWHHLAPLVRLQLYNVHWEKGYLDGTAGVVATQRMLMPSMFRAGMKVHSAMAVALNELGPVVCDGRVNIPFIPGASSKGWFDILNTFSNAVTTAGTTVLPFCWPLASTQPGSWVPNITWSTSTLNTAWITAYKTAYTGDMHLFVPWEAAGRLGEIAVMRSTNTVAYGRGFTFFPMSNNIRGGLGMLTGISPARGKDTWVQGAFDYAGFLPKVIDLNTFSSAATPTVLSTTVMGVASLASAVPLSPEEAAVVFYCPWILQFRTLYSKYKLDIFGAGGVNSVQDSIAADLCSPGGVFMQMLSDAMMKRHGSISSAGVVGPNDNPDVCLWDAAKAIFRTIGTTLLDIAPVAAGVGCNVVVAGSGPACALLASNVTSTIRDLAGVGTIRHASSNPGKELDKIAKEVKEVARASKGLEPQQRSAPAVVDYRATPQGVKAIERQHPKSITNKQPAKPQKKKPAAKGVKNTKVGMTFPVYTTKKGRGTLNRVG